MAPATSSAGLVRTRAYYPRTVLAGTPTAAVALA
jgi:hypothetical protein